MGEVDQGQVEEMVKVLEVVEMAVRRISVDFTLDANVGHIRAWSSLQRKLRYLSAQSKSASWSAEFHEVMKHARMMRKVVLTDETKAAARTNCSHCMVCGSKEDSCAYAVEFVCSPCDQEGVPPDALLECTPAELHTNGLVLVDEFTLVASEDDLDTVRDTTTTPPPGYMGVFATGKTCFQRIESAMLAKTLIPNEILRVESELGKLSASTLRAMRKAPDKFKTASKEHATRLCKKIRALEVQLASKRAQPVPTSESVVNDEVFERVDHWLLVNSQNMEREGEEDDIAGLVVKASADRSRGLLGCEDGEANAWANVFAFDKLELKEEPQKRKREDDSPLRPPRRRRPRRSLVLSEGESEGESDGESDGEVIEVEEAVEEEQEGGESDGEVIEAEEAAQDDQEGGEGEPPRRPTLSTLGQLQVFAHREAIRELQQGRAPKGFEVVREALEAVKDEADVLKAVRIYAHKRAAAELETKGTALEFALLQRAMASLITPHQIV